MNIFRLEPRNGNLRHVAQLLCEQQLGELDMMLKVADVKIYPFDTVVVPNGASEGVLRHRLQDLPAVFDAFLAH